VANTPLLLFLPFAAVLAFAFVVAVAIVFLVVIPAGDLLFPAFPPQLCHLDRSVTASP